MPYTPYALPLLATVGLLLGLVVYAFRQRGLPGAPAFGLTSVEVLVLVRALRQAQGSTPACSGRC